MTLLSQLLGELGPPGMETTALLVLLTEYPLLAWSLVAFTSLCFLVLLRYARRLRRAHQQLVREKAVVVGFLQDISEAFEGDMDLEIEELLTQVLYYAHRTARAGGAAIYLLEGDFLHARSITGFLPPMAELDVDKLKVASSLSEYAAEQLRLLPIQLGEGLVGEVARYGKPILIPHANEDRRLPVHPHKLLGFTSVMIVPMRFRGHIQGVLVLANPTDAAPFNQHDIGLIQALADQSSLALHYARLKNDLVEKERLDRELDFAYEIQQSLLPKELPDFLHLELSATSIPARHVGGDYYDCLRPDDQHIGLVIADVSGKGVAGALMTALCRSAFRTHAKGLLDPSEMLSRVYETVQGDIPEDMFITIGYLIIHIDTGSYAYSSAGHEPLLHLLADGVTLHEINPAGPAVGMAPNAAHFRRLIQTATGELEFGDRLVLYTDGVTEAMNRNEDEWGKEDLYRVIREGRGIKSTELQDNIIQQLLRFTGDVAQSDDVTLIILGVKS
ncbi:MAG: sigma-B regulation protein RsbU (phosphoserine phosphatase) [Kiritimatiellia bacterium]|jgi:sigma-B regulation protein RsbU (phosphoserine phosphatase)